MTGGLPSAGSAAQQRLWRAVDVGDAPGVRDALAAGASAALRGPSGLTSLMVAVKRRDSDCVGALRAGSDLGATDPLYRTALMLAAENSDLACVEILADKSSCSARMFDGSTALNLAARGCSAQCIEALLKWSDPDAADWHGLTPLMAAAMRGFYDGAQLLAPLSDLSARDSNEKTAQDWAEDGHHIEVADYLAAVALSRSERDALGDVESPKDLMCSAGRLLNVHRL